MIKIRKAPEFEEWINSLRLKEQAQIEARLFRIENFGHFGDCKSIEGIDHALYELRWNNGWRLYFYRDGASSIIILLGGKKNDQKKDIKKAAILLRRYAHSED
jgi:putative addiction module killer protein